MDWALLASMDLREPDPVGDALGVVLLAALAVALLYLPYRWWTSRDLRVAGRSDAPSIDEWKRRGLGVRRSKGIIEFQAGQRCPLCHVEHAPTSEAARCDACGTLSHLQCAIEVGRCSTLGCAGEVQRVSAVREGAARGR